MSTLPMQRIDNLAKRLGIGFREAARLCSRKGNRLKRKRQCACAVEQPADDRIRRLRWDLRGEA